MQNVKYIENEKLNSVLQNYIKKILKKEIKPNFKGSYSYCYECGNFVILRSINKISSAEKQNSNFINLQKMINKLKLEHNVNTPTLFAEFVINNQRFTIQERAKGLNLSIYYPHTAKALAYKSFVCDENTTKKERELEEQILPSEEKIIGDFLFKYNNKVLRQLLEAKQKIFDKYVKDFATLIKNGIQIDFYRSENFIFSKEKGISFIDLSFKENNNQNNINLNVNDMLAPFKDFLNFAKFMNKKQINVLQNNLNAVYEKLFNALYNNNLISEEELTHLLCKDENNEKLGNECEV